MASAGNRLAWTDVETDGLVAHKCRLLEVACVITDTNMRDMAVLSETPFHAVVGYSESEIAQMYEASDDIIREMHEKTGLWERLLDGTPLAEVDLALLDFIKEHCPEREQGHIAGNSVRLDMNFVDEHLPLVSDHLHYRMLDVSSFSLVDEWISGSRIKKASDHTALVDITESLEEMRIMAGAFARGIDALGSEMPRATPRALASLRD